MLLELLKMIMGKKSRYIIGQFKQTYFPTESTFVWFPIIHEKLE